MTGISNGRTGDCNGDDVWIRLATLIGAIRGGISSPVRAPFALLDALRQDARGAGLETLAMVAAACEQAVATAGGRLGPAAATCWSAALEDAFQLERDCRILAQRIDAQQSRAAAESLVASVAVRLRA